MTTTMNGSSRAARPPRSSLSEQLDRMDGILDGLSEAAIIETLKSRAGKRTTIVISHHRSTISFCDDVVVLSGGRCLYGGALLILLWAVAGAGAPPRDELWSLLPLLAVQGAVLGLGGTLLWYEAIARLDLTRATAIVVPLIPLLSLAASFALLGEVATPRQWLGLGLTAFGILVFVTGPAAVSSPARAATD